MGTAARAGLAVLLSWGCATGCTGPSSVGPSDARPAGGVTLQTRVFRLTGGALEIDYDVSNGSKDPVVVADGVPAADTTYLPEADDDAAYVLMRAGGTVEVSRRTFDAPAWATRPGAALMRGTTLPAGASRAGKVVLTAPITLYRPYESARDPVQVPDSAHQITFCLGVVDPSDLEASLQGLAEDNHPVLRHPTPQLVLCTPETELPR